jgi:hypothetical protein
MDTFDQWWEWAEKPLDSHLTIPAEINEAVMAMPLAERRDRKKVNQTVQTYPATPNPDGALPI